MQATRTGKRDRLSHQQAVLLIEAFLRFPVQETTVPVVQAALAAKGIDPFRKLRRSG